MSKLIRILIDVSVAVLLGVALLGVYWIDSHSTQTDVPPVPSETEPKPAPRKYRLAVTTGGHEDMTGLLEKLGEGYQIETIDEDTLLDPEKTKKFEVVFLTCALPRAPRKGPDGSSEPSPLATALRKFVADGGTLYASDLRYDVLSEAFREFVDQKAIAQGFREEALRAAVVAPDLRDWLGNTKTVSLHFDREGWRPAAFIGNGVTVYLRGSFKVNGGTLEDVPLLVRFPYRKGAVLFTSFHNTSQNSEFEEKLLKYLVLSTLTARVEAQIERGGFSPKDKSLLTRTLGDPSVTRTFHHPKAGPLRFSLGFEDQGARFRLEVTPPSGSGGPMVDKGSSTITIDVPEAAAGEWRYTAVAESLPFKDFRYVLAASVPEGPEEPEDGPTPPPASGPRVKFVKVPLETVPRPSSGQLRIGVTRPQMDDIEKILEPLGKGYGFDTISDDDLITPSSLDRFDIVFLTCGGGSKNWEEAVLGPSERKNMVAVTYKTEIVKKLRETLRRFVERGGTLYASDLRLSLLYMAFGERYPEFRPNLAILKQVEEAEREWIKVTVPAAKVGTIAEELRKVAAGKPMEEKLDLVIALVERSSLVKGSLDRARNPALPLVQREFGDVNLVLPQTDIEAIAKTLEHWDRAIRDAYQRRSPRSKASAQDEIEGAWENLKSLRTRCFSLGSGRENQKVTARIVDSGLREALGGPTITLNFTQNGWLPARFRGDDVTEYIRGEFEQTTGERVEAPLLVKFPVEKGTVIFTSFHNETVTSKDEEKLLKHLVFSAMTASEEAAADKTMLKGGEFSPTKRSRFSHTPGDPSITGIYKSDRPGTLRFALTFRGQGARLKFTLIAPNRVDKFEEEESSTLIVEASDAPAGEWTYTVTAVQVPFENFPFNVSVGQVAAKPAAR